MLQHPTHTCKHRHMGCGLGLQIYIIDLSPPPPPPSPAPSYSSFFILNEWLVDSAAQYIYVSIKRSPVCVVTWTRAGRAPGVTVRTPPTETDSLCTRKVFIQLINLQMMQKGLFLLNIHLFSVSRTNKAGNGSISSLKTHFWNSYFLILTQDFSSLSVMFRKFIQTDSEAAASHVHVNCSFDLIHVIESKSFCNIITHTQ